MRLAGLLWLALALSACARDNGLVTFNRGPSATITAPPEGTVVVQESEVTLAGVVSDDTGVWELVVEWASDLDGKLLEGDTPDRDGVVTFTTVNLSPGRHAITLTALDPQAESAEDTQVLTVLPLARVPTVAVVHPTTGERGEEGVGVDLVARVDDDDDPLDALIVTVTSDRDGEVCRVGSDLLGVAACAAVLTPGEHSLSFEVADPDGHAAEALAFVEVLARVDIDDDGDGWTESQGDCDDADHHLYPGAPENLDGVDNDCDGTIDEGTAAYDDDGDGYTEAGGDCDDGDSSIQPGALESCDTIDNDCDGVVDEEDASGCDLYYFDGDGDGYGISDSRCLCDKTGAYDTTRPGDCYDLNANAFPGSGFEAAVARGDGSFDYDCDGSESVGDASLAACGHFPGCASIAGWVSGVPSCGVSDTWSLGCYKDGAAKCVYDTETRAQACH